MIETIQNDEGVDSVADNGLNQATNGSSPSADAEEYYYSVNPKDWMWFTSTHGIFQRATGMALFLLLWQKLLYWSIRQHGGNLANSNSAEENRFPAGFAIFFACPWSSITNNFGKLVIYIPLLGMKKISLLSIITTFVCATLSVLAQSVTFEDSVIENSPVQPSVFLRTRILRSQICKVLQL